MPVSYTHLDVYKRQLGDLLEGIVLHAFEGKAPFGKESLAQIGELKKIYNMTLRANDSHHLKERAS